ncbi:SPASM domain-containing protein [Sinosporangium siamense]|uniref:Radical SAM protein n=1 Tax=Sinosporangium siamense TaxID=1367973 RepID=A0A919RDI6_9ACTN|nr:SPASM domain-containing protein [Sinosporangium siamense]GII90449.1 hypothetical protein Ssi02_06800 [Sinosporangium siamense]
MEVYSHLAHLPDRLLEVFALPGVRIACSFYSDDESEHRQITGRDTLKSTQENIVRVLDRSIPLRIGMVHILEGQRIEQAKDLLTTMGVTEIGVDRLRLLGRPQRKAPEITELCGACGLRSAAVLPNGEVTPCPLARWMAVGDVRELGLRNALDRMRPAADKIAAALQEIRMCGPHNDGQCYPCEPSCNPGCDPGVDLEEE